MSGEEQQQEKTQASSANELQKKEAPDWLIENISGASKDATRIFFFYIGYLSYCALTILSTTDRKLILDEAVNLPVVKVDVPLTGFLLLGPIIAMVVFGYLHCCLSKVRNLTNTLNDVYSSVEKGRIDSWIVNASNDSNQTSIDRTIFSIVNFFIWHLLPITMLLAVVWYAKVHNPIFSYVFAMIPIVGTFLITISRYYYESIGIRTFFRVLLWKVPILCIFFFVVNSWPMVFYLIEPSISHIHFQLLLLYWMVTGTILGILAAFWAWLRRRIRKSRGLPAKTGSKMVFASYIFSISLTLLFIVIPLSNKGKGLVVGLGFQNLVTEPTTDYEQLYWGDFRHVHLEGANLRSTVMKRAYLYKAYLQHAHMDDAVLEGANLSEADLRGASLRGANLKGANLEETNLRKADLTHASLQGADLKNADLQGTDLYGANFQDTNLRGTKLAAREIYRVKTLYRAKLAPWLMKKIQKECPHLLEKPSDK